MILESDPLWTCALREFQYRPVKIPHERGGKLSLPIPDKTGVKSQHCSPVCTVLDSPENAFSSTACWVCETDCTNLDTASRGAWTSDVAACSPVFRKNVLLPQHTGLKLSTCGCERPGKLGRSHGRWYTITSSLVARK